MDQLLEPWYSGALPHGIIVEERGVLYKWETPKALRTRQLMTRILPHAFYQVAMSTFPLSPIYGHMGIENKLWQLLLQFWWTGIIYQMKQWVLS